MLWTPLSCFNWTTDNFGSTLTDAGFGTSATAGVANVKGTPVSLIAGASVTQDVYGISIIGCNAFIAATIIRILGDLLIDPAGGTSWSVAIANLLFNSPSLNFGGYRYYFPLYLKAGTSIGWQHQSNVASRVMRVGAKLFGKPTKEELVKAGSKVQTFGAVTGTTSGTAITPGSGVVGAWTASLGTMSYDQWWWQWGGIATNDTTLTPKKGHYGDICVGDATNKVLVAQGILMGYDTGEETFKDCMGIIPPYYHAKTGQSVYARTWATGAADTTPTTTAYGLGG